MHDDYYKELVSTIHGIQAYRKAFNLVNNEAKRDIKVSRVSPMLLAFGLEKALKAVALFYDKKNRVWGHNLIKIFEQLDEKTQLHLILYAGYKPRHFWRMMHTNADAFEVWRYIEEPKKEAVFFSDPDIMLEIIEICVSLLYTEAIKEATRIKGGAIRSRKEADRILFNT